MKSLFILCLTLFLSINNLLAQGSGTLSGGLETQHNFFIRDSIIGAANTPQYDRQKYGSNTWVTLNYQNWGFDIGLRFDAFYNSNLVDPLDSYTALGIGRWHIRKEIFGLDITAGYIYDQIGSGTIFRSYEARQLAIDNALVGARLMYKIGDYITLKAFAGQQKKVEKQKNLFENYQPVILGGSVDGSFVIGAEKDDEGNITSTKNAVILNPGIGAIRRTLDDETMNNIVTDISSYAPEDIFTPKYTTYAFTAYNTLSWKGFTWFAEGAYKTNEAINTFNPKGVLEDYSGYNIYTSLAYARKGLGITAQYKRTDHFILRTSPLQTLTRGQIAFLPPMARQNAYRLTARYNAATQEVGEQALQLDILYSPIPRKLTFLLNIANITRLEQSFVDLKSPLYREIHFEGAYKFKRKWKAMAGFQFQQYNQEIYEQKPGVPIVTTYIPFAEFSYRFDRKKSLRAEFQYMHTDQDYGSWLYGLLEFNIAPSWSFTISDMISISKKKYDNIEHFYTFLVSYTNNSNRFDLSYVKQVEGIVCSGGVCRYEPAFNGVKFNVTSRF